MVDIPFGEMGVNIAPSRPPMSERISRVRKWAEKPLSAIGLVAEEKIFQWKYNLWNAPGYFHTRPEERYFYTIFKQTLIQERGQRVLNEVDKLYAMRLGDRLTKRGQEMSGISKEDKVRLQEDAQRVAHLYEAHRLNPNADTANALDTAIAAIHKR